MFCPKCQCEYREGFTMCSDCNIPLVDEFSKEIEPKRENVKYVDYVFLFSSFRYTDIAQTKCIFDGGDITYFIQGENMGVAPGGIPARVLVKKEQVEEAKELLKEFGLL